LHLFMLLLLPACAHAILYDLDVSPLFLCRLIPTQPSKSASNILHSKNEPWFSG
jgi:hypothetical protein